MLWGTGMMRTVDCSTLIPDENLTVDEGAVAPWNSLMWSLMADVCRAMRVRTDVPFQELTDEEKESVYDGPMVKKHIFYRPKNKESVSAGEMDFTYYSATATVLNALHKVKFLAGKKLPDHVKAVAAYGISQVKLIDAVPIGTSIRSTVATYANVHDELRKVYARCKDAKEKGYKAGDFSYNTGKLRCPVCDGMGTISLDVQFLPDVDVPCPECGDSRYAKEAYVVKRVRKDGMELSLPKMMACMQRGWGAPPV